MNERDWREIVNDDGQMDKNRWMKSKMMMRRRRRNEKKEEEEQ